MISTAHPAEPPPSRSPSTGPSAAPAPSDEARRFNATLLLEPTFQAAHVITNLRPTENPLGHLIELATQLKQLVATIASGDMQHPESLAVAQATVLNVMFGRLTEHAMAHINAPYFESLMRLAFRAQHQSLRALETLRRLKSTTPPPAPQ